MSERIRIEQWTEFWPGGGMRFRARAVDRNGDGMYTSPPRKSEQAALADVRLWLDRNGVAIPEEFQRPPAARIGGRCCT